jgi:hypothetical protein
MEWRARRESSAPCKPCASRALTNSYGRSEQPKIDTNLTGVSVEMLPDEYVLA